MIAFKERGNTPALLRMKKKLLELHPPAHQLNYTIGHSFVALEDDDRAIEYYEKIHKMDELYDLAQIAIGNIYEKQNIPNKAIGYYKKVPPHSPYYITAQINIGKAQGLKDGAQNFINTEISTIYKNKAKEFDIQSKKYARNFIIMVIVTIAVIIGLAIFFLFAPIVKGIEPYTNIKLIIFSSTTIFLLVWLIKYFNRRLHETICLKEEYEHTAIILDLFIPYGNQIRDLSKNDTTSLLDFTQKVSATLNKSPSLLLSNKKCDSTQSQEVIDLIKIMNK